jgi:hypothetical protein
MFYDGPARLKHILCETCDRRQASTMPLLTLMLFPNKYNIHIRIDFDFELGFVFEWAS